jgi:hypothetical protein
MAELVAFVSGTHEADLREVLTAYLEEGAARLERAFGFEQDVPAAVEYLMRQLNQFAPPAGRLLLVIEHAAVLGCSGLRPIAPGSPRSSGCTCGPRQGDAASADSCSRRCWPLHGRRAISRSASIPTG